MSAAQPSNRVYTLLVLGTQDALGYWEPRLRAVYEPKRVKFISHPHQLYGYRGPETAFTVVGETPDRYAEMMAILDRQNIKYLQAKEPEVTT